jgi:autotransporter passenger strand-loop-strand repeat protein
VQEVYGDASGVTVLFAGSQVVEAGGTATSTVISDGGHEIVYGHDFGATINSGGEQDVYGTASGVVVNADGHQIVEAGGTVTGTTIYAFGLEIVSAGSSDVSATIDGGQQDVYGTASGEIIQNGGTQNVYSGGTTSDVQVKNGVPSGCLFERYRKRDHRQRRRHARGGRRRHCEQRSDPRVGIRRFRRLGCRRDDKHRRRATCLWQRQRGLGPGWWLPVCRERRHGEPRPSTDRKSSRRAAMTSARC